MVRHGVAAGAAVLVVAAIVGVVLARGQNADPLERQNVTVGVATEPIRDVTAQPFSPTPDAAAAAQPAVAAFSEDAMQNLSLVRPRFKRGGYGSKALLSFTIRNRNAFPVKDVAMRCEFAGQDGRFVTSRTRVLNDTVKSKSRKRFGPTLIGFVGVTHSQARCAIVTASRADV